MTGERRKEAVIIAALILLIGAFHVTALREGHEWGDFAHYVLHAKNIAEGAAYSDTGYIFNLSSPAVGEPTKPPVLPLLLAPVYKVFGLDLHAMKVELIIVFLAFLLVVFIAFAGELPFRWRAALVAVVGLNPLFEEFTDFILSDLVFLLPAYLSLHLINREYKKDRPGLACAAAVGLLIYISYGTRSVGIVIVPSLILFDLIKNRRPTAFAATATVTFLALYGVQALLSHSDKGYIEIMESKENIVAAYFHTVVKILKKFSYLWKNGYAKIFTSAMGIIFIVLATKGYYSRVMRGLTVYEVFAPIYLLVLAFFVTTSPAAEEVRFIFPLIPLYIFYALKAVKDSSWLDSKGATKMAAAALFIAVFLTYGAKYTTLDLSPMDRGVGTVEAQEMFEYVKDKTAPDAVFIFRKPRSLALFTGRSASTYHRPGSDRDLRKYMKKIDATHIITARPLDDEYLPGFVERNGVYLKEVYSNRDFKVYVIKGS